MLILEQQPDSGSSNDDLFEDDDAPLDRLLHTLLTELNISKSPTITPADTEIANNTNHTTEENNPIEENTGEPPPSAWITLTLDAKEQCDNYSDKDHALTHSTIDILRTTVSFSGVATSAVLDTGSTVSFISRTFLGQLQRRRKGHVHTSTASRPLRVKLGDSSTLVVTETTRLTFALGKRNVTHSFYVMDRLPTVVLLGIDFMKRQNAVIDIGRQVLHLRSANVVVPITTASGRSLDMPIALRTDRAVVIPPHATLLVKVSTWTTSHARLRIEGPLDCRQADVEGQRFHLHDGITLVSDGHATLPLVNYAETPALVPAHTIVALGVILNNEEVPPPPADAELHMLTSAGIDKVKPPPICVMSKRTHQRFHKRSCLA